MAATRAGTSRWRRSTAAAVFSLTVTMGLACRDGDGPGTGSGSLQPTLASIQRQVFDVSCALAKCHAGPQSETGLDLRPSHASRSLVGVPSAQIREMMRVAPGAPERSYLIRKLEGTAIVGEPMPLGKERLPPETIRVIRRWIERGAPGD